jgi:hypothetical protein
MGLPYSFSPRLDRENNAKLYKLELISKPDTGQYAAYLNQRGFRRFVLEVDEQPVKNEKQLDTFFARFGQHLKEQGGGE